MEPHEKIWTLATAIVASRCLHVVAELGVADQIGDDPVEVDALADRCGADPGALDRVLYLLTAHGVFARTGNGYSHTDASRLLRTDHPMSMRAYPRMVGLPVFNQTFTDLGHTVRTGAPAIDLSLPGGLWSYLQEHPEENRLFGAAMQAQAAGDIAAVIGAYDFDPFEVVADIGGGRGHLLRAVLDASPRTSGILFDLPEVIGSVDVRQERLKPVAGDFFVDPLPAADCYLLMQVIHDWSDAEAIAILNAVRRAAQPGATVLIIEGVLDPERPDPRVQTLDVMMLVAAGGCERSPAQLRNLLDKAGFRLTSVIRTPGPLSLVEAAAT